MKKGVEFDKYVNLIRSRAWEYSKKYGIEYSELESQGYLIYCECLEKYDVTKSGFSTYLYIQLNRLGDFVKTYKRQQGYFLDNNSIYNDDGEELFTSDILPAPEELTTVSQLLESAICYLSDEAFELLKWIIGRSWEQKYKPVPTIKMAMKFFDKSQEVIEKLWDECKSYWNNVGCLLYA